MKIAFLTTLLFAFTALAAPVRDHTQHRFRKLEVTILDVITDINQGGAHMHTDYHSGLEQFKDLLKKLPGGNACDSLPSSQAKSEEKVVKLLLNSRQGLLDLAAAYAGEDVPSASKVHTDICKAYNQYRATHPYIKSL